MQGEADPGNGDARDSGYLDHVPTRSELAELCSGVDDEAARLHHDSFPSRYFMDFPIRELCTHMREAALLDDDQPYRLIVERGAQPGLVDVTVISYDYLGEFSVITGLLSASGMNVVSGDVYTSRAAGGGELAAAEASQQTSASRSTHQHGSGYHRSRGRPRRLSPQQMRRLRQQQQSRRPNRRIIDKFTGYVSGDLYDWEAAFRPKLDRFLRLLHQNTEEALTHAKQGLHEEVASALSRSGATEKPVLYPVHIEFDTGKSDVTSMRIVSEDTPFFLYALSTAFALHDISIERVEIRTSGTQIEDYFDVVDSRGRPITDQRHLDQIRLSIIFTKQFSYFLDNSPDPYSALVRFETLAQDLLELYEQGQLRDALSSPTVLQDLARVLGASDFLWEDFIRLQYENLLPLLQSSEERALLSTHPDHLDGALEARLAERSTPEEKKQALNQFKDQETYLVDLDHILNPDLDFFFLSSRLTAVAEVIVRHAVLLAWEALEPRYGTPRTVAGIRAPYAILGLGKLGGEAMGYASDIELMFVYGDDGHTDGGTQGGDAIPNAEFFQRLFQDAVGLIEAKREGIFQVDLRLRPHGNAGPLATSLSNFVSYYKNDAMSFEKLALIRLRRVGGDPELGAQVERIRDELVYAAEGIDLEEIQRLRTKQLEDKSRPGQLNVKFSPGGLVDLEYSVQILQATLGRHDPNLRTPRIHQALEALVEAGELDEEQAHRLVQAYRFLRSVINGLRMLRGNAKDLFLPPVDSSEYMHLARRTGYSAEGDLSPAERLHMEFETRTAEVRAFVERELGREALPGRPQGTIADLIVLDEIDAERRDRILADARFQDPERAYRNIMKLADSGDRRYLFAELAILAWGPLCDTPDPDMALNNWEQFARALPDPQEHFRQLQLQPKRLEVLLHLFAGSQFLSDTLIGNPDFLDWVTTPQVVTRARSETEIYGDILQDAQRAEQDEEWMRLLRRFRKREILRIGTRDIALGIDIEIIMTELSSLARALTRATLYRIEQSLDTDLSKLAVLAFGKLGGRELNYSSDIDLLGIYLSDEDEGDTAIRRYSQAMTMLREHLSSHTAEGYVYRVDFRLRPFGNSGALVQPLDAMLRYYQDQASAWEIQALLKLSPVAGNGELAWRFLKEVRPHFLQAWDRERVVQTIRHMRQAAVRQAASGQLRSGTNVKTGEGGIRDIEFLIQGLQLLHCREHPALLTGNTLEALRILQRNALLDPETARELHADYRFLRRLEHFLQILQDRQVHSLPRNEEAKKSLARRMQRAEHFDEPFDDVLEAVRSRVRRHYDAILR
jgi:glutamate-ammonia-ligase adenylyltransferase